MKIGFDAKRFFNNKTGLGNYSRTLLKNIFKVQPENNYILYSPKKNDKEVIITNVYVKDSQKIQSNTHLVDYETSKANFELHSEVGGFIRLKCNEGDTVEVSSAIIEIYEEPFVNDAKGEKESKPIFS